MKRNPFIFSLLVSVVFIIMTICAESVYTYAQDTFDDNQGGIITLSPEQVGENYKTLKGQEVHTVIWLEDYFLGTPYGQGRKDDDTYEFSIRFREKEKPDEKRYIEIIATVGGKSFGNISLKNAELLSKGKNAKKVLKQIDDLENLNTQENVAAPETTAPTEAAFTEMQKGDSGKKVKKSQKLLIALGFLSGSADGKFGPGTEQAVKEFQTAAGLSATGIIDEATYEALRNDNAPHRETEAKETDPPKPELNSSNTSRMYATTNVNIRSGPSSNTEKLGMLSRGEAVQAGNAENGWTPIIVSAGIGYVSSEYLSAYAPVLTPETTAAAADVGIRSTGETVWIPTNGGKKYHSKSTCSGMINPEPVSKSQAEAMGFGPCGRCYR